MLANAQLMLKSGEVFCGQLSTPTAQSCVGEVVFNTGMTGYVESLTDPSYTGQILVFTYPLIGNYGVTPSTSWESTKIHVSGVVVSELAPFHVHHQAQQSLLAWLSSQHIPCLSGVDTRALTKCLRTKGVIAGAIVLENATIPTIDLPQIDCLKKVSISEPICYGSGEKLIIAVDCGMKENILNCLKQFPVRIKRVPYNYDYSEEAFDGVFLSNGPGDPEACVETIAILRKVMTKQKPIFGICLGTQLMALAVGAKTYKLRFGHRSQNQPCLHLPTNRCYLTSQNHGYAIDEHSLPNDWQVIFRNLNDQSVAGIAHRNLPYFSVQFHPEAAPGPEETQWLFKQFYDHVSIS